MKLNTSKSHVLMIPNVNSRVLFNVHNASIKIGKYDISSSCEETLLGILIDNKLTFEPYVENRCRKAANKFHALIRRSKYMTTQQNKICHECFYQITIWLLHTYLEVFRSRSANTHISRIHERALRNVYIDYVSTFAELLQKDNTVSILHRNIQILTLEISKI